MSISEKRNKRLCCIIAAIMLLTVAFTLPLVTGNENAYAAVGGDYEYSVSKNSATITQPPCTESAGDGTGAESPNS
jgi:hypothetical protein